MLNKWERQHYCSSVMRCSMERPDGFCEAARSGRGAPSLTTRVMALPTPV